MRIFFTLSALIFSAGIATAQGNGAPGAHFIENWDMDGDGQVTVAEVTEKRGDIFYMFDQDEDGFLSAPEYDLFDETRRADMAENAGGVKGPMQAVNTAMSRDFNDTDKDGRVSIAEFTNNSAQFFKMIDRNGDGLVDTADFEPGG